MGQGNSFFAAIFVRKINLNWPRTIFCFLGKLVYIFFFIILCKNCMVVHEQMFTNGMSETMSSEVYIRDVSPEAFQTMLKFMYSGELIKDVTMESDFLLLQLLLLADQFGVTLLHQECCKILLECLSEVVWKPLSRMLVKIN